VPSYAVFLAQGVHPPTMKPIARAQSPQAVGFGMVSTCTADRKKKKSEIPKKIMPMAYSLKTPVSTLVS
jgi:hypothetical protein